MLIKKVKNVSLTVMEQDGTARNTIPLKKKKKTDWNILELKIYHTKWYFVNLSVALSNEYVTPPNGGLSEYILKELSITQDYSIVISRSLTLRSFNGGVKSYDKNLC